MKIPDPRRDPHALLSRPAAAIVIALLVAAYVAGYAWGAPNTDTADELWHALRIRDGIAYPAEGPYLGGAIHLGPAWFYLVAIPLWISRSWLAPSLFIGFVCALKFPLAYHCGRRLLDRDFGVLWAAAMFVPGWTTVEELVFLNPNAVATAVLAVLALCLRGMAAGMGPAGFATLGLAMALAIHVHPTAIPIFLVAVPLVLRIRPRSAIAPRALLPLALGFAVPFLPYAASQAMHGFPDWGSASAYMAGQVSAANIVNAPSVIANDFVAGPATIAQFVLGWDRAAAEGLGIAMAATAAASILALAIPRSRGIFVGFAGALVLFAAWIACLRPTTPVQFTWVLGPVAGGLMALGAWALARVPAARPAVIAAVAASIAFNAVVVRALALTVRAGEGALPSRILDIKDRIPRTTYRDVWFPALRHGDLGRALCSAPSKASLHGHLAYVADKDLGLDAAFACPGKAQPVLIGTEPRSHWLGMTRPFWKALGASPDCLIGSLGLTTRATPLVPRAGIAIADGSTYLPRRGARVPARAVEIAASAPRGSAVLVTNVLGGYESFEVVAARIDGAPVAPVAGNDLSALYRGPGGNGDAAWSFTVLTTNADAVDVVAIDLARGAAGCPSGRAPGS
jgi:hypothetical protein